MRIDIEKLQAALDAQDVTKSELARLSGVSRTAIHGILRDSNKQVRRETVRKLAATLNLSPDYITIGGVRSSYLDWLSQRYGTVDFHGLGIAQLPSISLDDLYVPTEVQVAESADADEKERSGRSTGPREPRAGLTEGADFSQAVFRHDRIALLGGPGSGKSTLLRYLAAIAAERQRTAATSAEMVWTPLFVRLAEYSNAAQHEAKLNPLAFVAAQARQDGRPDPESFLAEELAQGRCIVLLDGLDEIAPAGQIARLVGNLAEFIERYPRNRFVVAARQVGFDGRPWQRLGFTRLCVTPWRDEQVRLFVRQWYAKHNSGTSARARSEAERSVRRLHEAILGNPRLRAIATNPLMLVILAALHESQAVLPRRRAELYGKIADTLLQSWEAAKFSARPGDLLHGTVLEGREYAWLLGHLALTMQCGDLTVVPHWWLADQVRAFLHETLGLDLEEAKSECDRVIRYLGERTGLFVETGQGLYAFWHLTFQEYFAARALLQESAAPLHESGANRGLTDFLRPRFHHPRWTEVVRLVAAQLSPMQTPTLLRSILDDSDPLGRFLRRGPLLALDCLADGAVAADPELVDEIFSAVLDLGQSHWLGITYETLRVLRRFEGTRLADKAQTTLESILASAEQHLSAAEVFQLRQVGDRTMRREVDGTLANREEGRPRLGTSVTIECQGTRVACHYLDPQLKASDPDTWYARAEELLQTNATDEGLEVALVRALATAVLTAPVAGRILRDTLRNSPSDRVREECADALAQLVSHDLDARALLAEGFRSDPSDEVRRACGAGLRHVAVEEETIRRMLLSGLRGGEPGPVRAGAAIGLKRVALIDRDVRRLLWQTADSPEEDTTVRVFCLGSLESCLERDRSVMELFVGLLHGEHVQSLGIVASELLAKAFSRNRIPWDPPTVRQVEENLMAVEHPRRHHLSALRALADAGEVRAMQSILERET